MPLGPGFRAPPKLIPGATTFPPVSTSFCEFRHVINGSLALALQISPDRFSSRLFLRRSPPTLLTPAARSGLEPAPDRPFREIYPHLSCSFTPPYGLVYSRHT